jgi:hypothetical protein
MSTSTTTNTTTTTTGTGRISKADIEAKLRRLQGDVEDTVTSNRQKIITAVAVVAVVTVSLAYLLGRRAGRKRNAIVEIRRY